MQRDSRWNVSGPRCAPEWSGGSPGRRLAARAALSALLALAAGCASEPQDRIARIYAWKGEPTPRNVAKIRSLLTDTDRDVRATALHALVAIAVPDAAEIAKAALSDPDGFVRAMAAKSLGSVGTRRDVAQLVELLASDPDWHARQRAVEALETLGGPDAISALNAALEDPVSGVRLAAVRALGSLDPAAAVGTLARMVLDDPEWEIRVHAVRALGLSRRTEALGALEAARDDPNEFVRATASLALKRLRSGPLESGGAEARPPTVEPAAEDQPVPQEPPSEYPPGSPRSREAEHEGASPERFATATLCIASGSDRVYIPRLVPDGARLATRPRVAAVLVSAYSGGVR